MTSYPFPYWHTLGRAKMRLTTWRFRHCHFVDMYVIRAKSTICHPAKQMGPEYITPCGLVVPETFLFDKPQDDFPRSYLIPKRPKGRRLCSRCKYVSQAQARKELTAKLLTALPNSDI